MPGEGNAAESPLRAISDGHLPAHAETEDSGVVIIDRFPFGSPGAPLTGLHDSTSRNGSSPAGVGLRGDSIWAPFHSECDWEFARWAKLRGPTSSAVTDLLAIPEVCTSLNHVPSVLMHCNRSSTSSGFRIETQENLIISSTTTWPGHPHFNAGSSTLDASTCSFIVAMPYSVCAHCLVTLNLHKTWCFHRSSITPMPRKHAVL